MTDIQLVFSFISVNSPSMNHLRILIPLTVLGSQLSSQGALSILNGGGPILIDSATVDHILVADSPGGDPTLATFGPSADVTGVSGNDQSLIVEGNSRATIDGGSFAQDIDIFSQSTLTMNSGNVGDDIYAYGNSSVFLNGGTITENLLFNDFSSGNVFGGTITDDLEVLDDAFVNVGGTVNVGGIVFLENFSTTNISGGIFNNDVRIFDGAAATISDGNFAGSMILRDGATLDISGGTFTGEFQVDTQVHITGGNFLLDAFGVGLATAGGLITLDGDFTLNGTPLENGELIDEFGVLEGTLADGSTITTFVDRNPFGAPEGSPDIGTIVIIPEPSSALLLSIALAPLLRRRRR